MLLTGRVLKKGNHGDTESTQVHEEKGGTQPQRAQGRRKDRQENAYPFAVLLCDLCVNPFLSSFSLCPLRLGFFFNTSMQV